MGGVGRLEITNATTPRLCEKEGQGYMLMGCSVITEGRGGVAGTVKSIKLGFRAFAAGRWLVGLRLPGVRLSVHFTVFIKQFREVRISTEVVQHLSTPKMSG